ncbi:MAG TPA: ribbon-helix-helix protein, CopG family [Dehalococcoidia bacterium]|nr:ribbon-helix-helix protein, CopG family [Dehalococcoidia bacterium]
MERSAKVAISLPENVLKDIEKERKARGESRSEFFRRAAERLLKHEKESADVKAYIHGYTVMPESAEEVKTAHQSAVKVLAGEPW